ncbi:MAG: hypothetical protein DRH04_09020 [Deltaproteobacteria bacterium]|nr:MAG: hypothetical protein DRH04_09020 [Deltaproteobacteria bacterium]
MKQKAIDLFSRGVVVIQVLPGMFLLLFLILLPSLIMAAAVEAPKNDSTPAMVRRHIFSPDDEKPADKAQGPRSEAAAKLEKEILFTGVIHSPQGKWAIIRPRNKSKREDASWRLSEGDEIKGYHVKEIGPNYIILVSKDKPVRLDLYRGSKKRPAPPAEPVVPLTPVPAAAAVNQGQRGGAKSVAPGVRSVPGSGTKTNVIRRRGLRPPAAASTKNANGENSVAGQPSTSLADILKRARQNSNTQTGGLPPTNPFSRIIQQRQEQ